MSPSVCFVSVIPSYLFELIDLKAFNHMNKFMSHCDSLDKSSPSILFLSQRFNRFNPSGLFNTNLVFDIRKEIQNR